MRIVSTFLLLMAMAVSLKAQKGIEWKQATAGGYTYRYVTNDPMGARFYTLKNGLTVILSKNTKEPRVAVRVAVRAGSNSDPVDHTGLAHYLEHLLFKGTDKYGSLDWSKEKPLLDQVEKLYEQYNKTTDPAQRKTIYQQIDQVSGEAAKYAIAGEYDRMMKVLGSQATNAHTWVEETVYEEDIPANAMDKFLAIQAERFRYPVFRIFHTELEAVYEEKNRGLDNDGNKMQEAMFSSIFPTHHYGQQTTIGTIEHLKNPSIVAIRQFYDKFYVPNNMAIIMAGDFNPDELVAKIDKQFAFMQPKPVEEYKGPKEAPINGPEVKEVFGPSAESVRLVYRAPAAGTRDAMLADLASSVLSNGNAGLIDLNLNKQQKVLGAGAGLWQYRDYGIFFLVASPKQGQTLEAAKDLLMGQLNDLKNGNFEESLIPAIVANSKLNELQGLENNGNRVNQLMDDYIKSKGASWNKNVAMIDEMKKVSKKELSDFAKGFFTDNNYVILYKRKGEDKNVTKVDKPPITPVETNEGKTSPFVAAVIESKLPAVKPVWIDYDNDLQKRQLNNAELLYVPNKENGLFRLTYQFDMGGWNNKLLPIAAQYLEYLGTDKLTSEAISKQFYNLACSFDVQPGDDQTAITISGLGENFEKAVRLFEDLIRNCQPDAEALENLKATILKARANNKLNKGSIARGLQSYAYYGAQNPFNYVLPEAALQALKPEDLTTILHSLFNYQHKIGYYGPLSLTASSGSLKNLHPLPGSWTSAPAPVKFERITQGSNKVLFANYDAVQSEIFWVRSLSKYDPKNEALVNVFNNYFGGGMGTIVFSVIRESKALAYSTYAFVNTPSRKSDPFSFVAYVGSQADKMNDAIKAMNELLNDLPQVEQGFTNARTGLMKDMETDRIQPNAIIASYLNAQRKGITVDQRQVNYEAYKNITLNDLDAFHREKLSQQPYTYCVVASDKKVSLDDLKKYGELKVLSLEEIFGY
ncbi:insulinase family protein [Flavihumibacter petaseus]|uniref:Peptidase M16 family protein n=1 Tax=Flavihumibacter petaseus NBRC 106054 TaxID=1220578 RepID=A0A0E9MZN4_9BACT|nr:insulinase family protein [Flavihumibacter petaseus]GAO43024.1 peptidase M16 family protein [Flavihumibacter petaseus NBRC 106054]